MTETSKEKGDLLEKIVSRICSGIKDAKTEADMKIMGRSGVTRQIDTLITGTMGAFEIRIIVDSKNYSHPVDLNDVESMAGMVLDVGANLGVIVCPAGFTDGAKKRAESAGIQLYEIYDQTLGNTSFFIPLRFIEARIDKYSFQFSGTSAAGPFSIPTDSSRWQLHVDGKLLIPDEVPVYLWNKDMVPQKAGEYAVEVGAVKITDTQDKNKVQYCDMTVHVVVAEDYYLKLFPASFMREAGELGKEQFDLRIDAYSKKEDMLKNGWKYFETMEEMNAAADIDNQPPGVRELLIRNFYTLG